MCSPISTWIAAAFSDHAEHVVDVGIAHTVGDQTLEALQRGRILATLEGPAAVHQDLSIARDVTQPDAAGGLRPGIPRVALLARRGRGG